MNVGSGISKTITSMVLESCDASGTPSGGHIWDTIPGHWILGVEDSFGNLLNSADSTINVPITTSSTFKLYCSDSGRFNQGQHFRITVKFRDGTMAQKVMSIGPAVMPTPTLTSTTRITPTPSPRPAPTITKFKKCVGDEPYLYVGDRIMGKGKTVEIPIIMCNAKDLANMDLDWSYDASVLKLIDVTKGSLTKKALFEWNEVSAGKLKIAFASSKGVSGSGSIAVMKFEVIGNTGAKSTITGTVDTASKTDGSTVSVGVNPGEVTVGTSPIKGDCDGDNKLTSRDALVALQISVQKRPFDICYDYNGDGKVNSADARDILKAIVTGGK